MCVRVQTSCLQRKEEYVLHIVPSPYAPCLTIPIPIPQTTHASKNGSPMQSALFDIASINHPSADCLQISPSVCRTLPYANQPHLSHIPTPATSEFLEEPELPYYFIA